MPDSRRNYGGTGSSVPVRQSVLAGKEDIRTGDLLVGVMVCSSFREISAVLVRVSGRGFQSQLELVDHAAAPVPKSIAAELRQLSAGVSAAAATGSVLASALTDLVVELVRPFIVGSGYSSESILAVGVHDPGLWNIGADGPNGYAGLCEADRLATQTGLCVVDAFAARDLALGGQGGPVLSAGQCLLLRDAGRHRVLLDLGQTVKLTFLPACSDAKDLDGVLSFDVGPGTVLLDTLAAQLTGGKQRYDPGGRFAVQGRKIPNLIEHWLADTYFQKPLPRWYPLGVRPHSELEQTVQMAVDSGWSVRDLLCTASHFIAECVALAFQRRLPGRKRIDEILVTGGGRHNGMLLSEISKRLADIPIRRLADLGWPDELFDAACVAGITHLHLEQTPANHPAITGANREDVLGRLTPGTQQAWHRVLRRLMRDRWATRSLRDAG